MSVVIDWIVILYDAVYDKIRSFDSSLVAALVAVCFCIFLIAVAILFIYLSIYNWRIPVAVLVVLLAIEGLYWLANVVKKR